MAVVAPVLTVEHVDVSAFAGSATSRSTTSGAVVRSVRMGGAATSTSSTRGSLRGYWGGGATSTSQTAGQLRRSVRAAGAATSTSAARGVLTVSVAQAPPSLGPGRSSVREVVGTSTVRGVVGFSTVWE